MRLLKASQVASELFSGTVSATWVKRNVPGKLRLGHSTVVWAEQDVRAWLDARFNARTPSLHLHQEAP
jgi:predicted DNA-binding transcriptional regulator AlpA